MWAMLAGAPTAGWRLTWWFLSSSAPAMGSVRLVVVWMGSADSAWTLGARAAWAGVAAKSMRLMAGWAVTVTMRGPATLPMTRRGLVSWEISRGDMLWCMRLPGGGALG